MVMMAASVAMGGQITINQTVYSYDVGGEFALTGLPGVLGNYSGGANSTKNIGYDQSFQTFCLEHGENFSPGTPYYYSISDRAYNGGVGTGGDPISIGTAYLYSQFAAGTLKGYFDNTQGRPDSARQLQNAIWWLEGEGGLSFDINNVFEKMVRDQYGYDSTHDRYLAMNDANGAFGVQVVNVWINEDHTGFAQDQLVITPEPATLLLYGFGLLGLDVWRRCRKS